MVFYTNPIACVIFALMIIFHIPILIFNNILSRVFACVNIALHISLIPVLLLGGAEFIESALLFMISVFFLTLGAYIKQRIKGRDKAGEEEGCDL